MSMSAKERPSNLDFVLVILLAGDAAEKRGQSLSIAAVFGRKLLEAPEGGTDILDDRPGDVARLGRCQQSCARPARWDIRSLRQAR
jgi:hypothetical protein